MGNIHELEQSFDDIEKLWGSNKDGILCYILHFVEKHSSKLVYAGSSTKFGDGGIEEIRVHMHGQKHQIQSWLKIMEIGLDSNLQLHIFIMFTVVGKYQQGSTQL